MKIEFNLTGTDRKNLVRAISEITGCPAEYQFMPTCAYIIGNCTVTKDGIPHFWLPRETLDLRVRRDHVPYDVSVN